MNEHNDPAAVVAESAPTKAKRVRNPAAKKIVAKKAPTKKVAAKKPAAKKTPAKKAATKSKAKTAAKPTRVRKAQKLWDKSKAKRIERGAEKSYKGPKERNGQKRPGEGYALRVWQIAESLKTKLKRHPYRAEVLSVARAEKIGAGSAAVYFSGYRKFNGITGRHQPEAGAKLPTKA